MSFLTDAQKLLPGLLGGFQRPQGRAVLALCPLRDPKVVWERAGEDQFIVITVKRKADIWNELATKIFGVPTTRKIELTDEISSYVWTCCDGNYTVSEIAADISRRYKLSKRQSEVSVLTFLKTLQIKQLIGITEAQARVFRHSTAELTPERTLPNPRRKGANVNGNRKRSGRSSR